MPNEFSDEPLDPHKSIMDIDILSLTAKEWHVRQQNQHKQDVANIFYKTYEDHIYGTLVRQLSATIWGQELATFSWPKTWWDHFKQHYAKQFPKWYLRRWPVEVQFIDIRAEYPSFKYDMKDHRAVVKVYRNR